MLGSQKSVELYESRVFYVTKSFVSFARYLNIGAALKRPWRDNVARIKKGHQTSFQDHSGTKLLVTTHLLEDPFSKYGKCAPGGVLWKPFARYYVTRVRNV
jgi:hypothetical protein